MSSAHAPFADKQYRPSAEHKPYLDHSLISPASPPSAVGMPQCAHVCAGRERYVKAKYVCLAYLLNSHTKRKVIAVTTTTNTAALAKAPALF